MAILNRLPFVAPGTPTLDLNFAARSVLIRNSANGPAAMLSLSDLPLTFSRPSPGWCFDSSGRLVQVPADTLRFAYHPVTRAGLGARLEPISANLCLWSNDFTKAVWVKTGMTPFGFARSGIGGDEDMTNLVDNGSAVGTLQQTVATSFAGGHTGGFFLRQVPGNTSLWRLRADFLGGTSPRVGDAVFDLATGSIVSTNGASARIRPGPVGTWLCEVLNFNTVSATGFRLGLERANSSDPASSVDVTQAQIEQRNTLTSPIPTQDAIVTRAADRLSLAVGPWLNQREGTMTAECVLEGDVGTPGWIAMLRNAAGSSFIALQKSQFASNGSIAAQSSSGVYMLMYGVETDSMQRIALSWRGSENVYRAVKSGGSGTYLDGGALVGSGTVPGDLSVLDLGHSAGADVMGGTLARIVIEPTLLPITPNLSARVSG